MDTSDLQLLALQVEALFTHDTAGRIVAINDPDGGPAPRFFLGRTRSGNLWRIRHDLPETTAVQLDTLAAAEPVRDDLRTDPHHMMAFLEVLRADREIQSIVSGPAYRFPDALPVMPAAVTRITGSNLHLLAHLQQMGWDLGILAGQLERWEPMVGLAEGDAAVSLCSSARLTERAAEAGVQTLEAYRGRGYAPAVVTAWAHAIRASGRVPLYSTSWENLASQAVAGKLGLVQYGTDLSLW
jgi:RimJ/RimL family protein N-acetyltransferase